MIKIITVICLLAFSNICYGQRSNINCKECDVAEAARIYNNLGLIDEKELYCFIIGFSVCKNNAEYMEYANPLLFDIVQHNSKALVGVLIKYPALNKKYVHDEIRHPLLDYDVKRVIAVVDSSNKNGTVKQQILTDLRAIKLDEHGYPR